MLHSFASLLAILTLSVSAAPTSKLITRQASAEVVDNEYIIKLKDGILSESHIAGLPFMNVVTDVIGEVTSLVSPASQIISVFDGTVFNGYVAKLTQEELDTILKAPEVEYVEPNQIMRTQVTQTGAPWGLQSISSRQPVGGNDAQSLKYEYNYDGCPGEGTDIYIIDTGIQVEHEEFGGRASWGWTAPSYVQKDGNGHGTHCAGTAAGKAFGVAKCANLIAVKVLSDEGSGAVSDIIKGIEYVVNSKKRPSIGSMSLGGTYTKSLNDAVQSAIEKGVQFAVAAGNSNQDAKLYSPASVKEAITVGASTITNEKAEFSNYGELLDIWAPGKDVTSAWIGDSNRETKMISGTSMATPHVAGLSAYLLAKEPGLNPAQLADKIKSLGTKGAIKTNGPVALPWLPALLKPKGGTTELLAFNGYKAY